MVWASGLALNGLSSGSGISNGYPTDILAHKSKGHWSISIDICFCSRKASVPILETSCSRTLGPDMSCSQIERQDRPFIITGGSCFGLPLHSIAVARLVKLSLRYQSWTMISELRIAELKESKKHIHICLQNGSSRIFQHFHNRFHHSLRRSRWCRWLPGFGERSSVNPTASQPLRAWFCHVLPCGICHVSPHLLRSNV